MSLANILKENCSYNLFCKTATACEGFNTTDDDGNVVPIVSEQNALLPYHMSYTSVEDPGPFESDPLMNWSIQTITYDGRNFYRVSGSVLAGLPSYVLSGVTTDSTLEISFSLAGVMTAAGVGTGVNKTVYYASGSVGNGVNSNANGYLQSDGDTVLFTFTQSGPTIALNNTNIPLALDVVFNPNSDGVFPVASMLTVTPLNPGPIPPWPIEITVGAGTPDFTLVTNVTFDQFPVDNLVITPALISFQMTAQPSLGQINYGVYLHSADDKYTECVYIFSMPTA